MAEELNDREERERARILSDYVDILNTEGVGSLADRKFRKKHRHNSRLSRLFSTARAMKALYKKT